jgi:pimeloyl-ACP methyl ester carboxylesterase
MPHGVVAGVPVSWETFGNGPRRALFLHPGLAQGRLWRAVAGPLGHRLAIIAPDLPGHGDSGDWDGQGDYLSRSTEIAGVLCEGPIDLVGHSMGAVVALAVALDRPRDVRTLTLIEPVLFAAVRGTPAFERYVTDMAPFEAACREGDLTAAAQAFLAVWGVGQPWEGLSSALQRDLARRIPLVRAADDGLFGDSCAILAPGRLEGFNRPVCLVGGDRSPQIVGGILDVLQSRLPDASRVTIRGAAHMLTVTHPGPVADAIGSSLARGGCAETRSEGTG